MLVDARRDRGSGPSGEVDADQPQALDRPVADATCAVPHR
jgi:hypothetical protein